MSNESPEIEIKKMQGPIVIFGAGGFIGASLFMAISKFRDDCYAVTHQDTIPYRLQNTDSDKIIHANLTDKNSLEVIFDKYKFRTIFNLSTYGGFAYQNETEKIFETNIIGLMNLVTVAEKYGFSALVQGGSSSEYGLNSKAPKESDELKPNSDYSVSKVASSYYMKFLGEVKQLPVIQLRYYSVYGPYESEDRLIPTLFKKASEQKFPSLANPEISRDYVYIDDVVEVTVLAATKGVINARGQALNIASGKKTTLKELITEVKTLCNIPHEPVWGSMENRAWDLTEWYGDATLAEKVLGWKAKTALKDGLQKQLVWQKNYVQPQIQKNKRDKLSAVIACYKDGQAISYMHERLTKVFTEMKVDYEIIFVNDGSPDNTNEILERITAADHHVIAIEHSRNFGSQAALISGSAIAKGDAIIWLEGDLQDTPETIPEFYFKWKEGFEVIYGVRDKREGNQTLIWFYRQFYKVFRKLSYINIPLDAGDFSFLDKKVIKHVLALPEKEQFLRGLRAWVGFKQTGVHYFRPERMFGVSTNNWRKNIWWAKKGIFSFSFVPLEMLSYAGLFLTLISFVAMIAQVIAKIMMPDIPHGLTTIIVLVLFFGGINLLGISILGEYLGKILEESKGRPKYIRKSIRYKGKYFNDPEDLDNFNKK
ncbi:MAG TPA: NAD-dependent epimerase/dehydratase family protein [Bacteroidia bacterium]|jgi:nucleoside-diphosphate-sugar epimerase/glycosyltransferase involved in cell wall biosynthesis|nr:NAD-dependent epimerase/dehydratase family protein [Bacteroidia bacterium]